MDLRNGKIQSAIVGVLVVALAAAAGVSAFFLLDSGRPISPLGPEYSYDLSAYAVIDPELILYAQVGRTIETGLSQSRVMVVSGGGTMLVAGDSRIVELDAGGGVVRTIECPAEPTCLALDEDGTLYAGLVDHVAVFDSAGNLTAQWDKPEDDTLLTSLAVTGEYVFAADAGYRVVRRYGKDGTLLATFGQRNPERNHPGFVIPSPFGFNLAAAPDGLLRVVNSGRHLVEAWTAGGHREWWWGQASIRIEGFSGCCNPSGLAILPNGHYITSEKGLVRIKEYDPEGHFLGVVAGPDELGWVEPLRVHERPEQSQVRGFGVATDAAGRVYVLDVVRNAIRIFERKTGTDN